MRHEMKNRVAARSLVALAALAVGSTFARDPVDWVNPEIGNISHLLVPTLQTVSRPNGMMRFNPPYRSFTDDRVDGLRLFVAGHRDSGLFVVQPWSGAPDALKDRWCSTWDQAHARPYRYDIWLDTFHTRVDYAPGEKAALMAFRFERPETHALVFAACAKEGTVAFSSGALAMTDRYHGGVVHLVAEFEPNPIRNVLSGRRLALHFPDAAGEVKMRYAVSYLSPEQATANLRAEMPDFDLDRVARDARAAWNEKLSLIRVEGGRDDERTVFYTSLYRCFERMVDVTEGDRFRGWDGRTHTVPEGRRRYTDDWIWDTFRAHHPLMALLQPKEEGDKLDSYIGMANENDEKWLPTFPNPFGDAHCMNGLHSVAPFIDAWRKGIRDFDLRAAFAAGARTMRTATKTPWVRGPKNELDAFYDAHGWFPALKESERETVAVVRDWEKRQAVAVTQAASFDAWCLAEMAKELGDAEGEREFRAQASNYRKLWKPDTQFFHPKDRDGKWIEPFDYKFSGGIGSRAYYDENNAWTYIWDVQHDIPGLIALFGGSDRFARKLDQMFNEPLGCRRFAWPSVQPDSSAMVGQFSMGNEPSLHIPYLYVHVGQPRKTQKLIRKLLKAWFRNDLMGVPGDEDGGGMCAFVVFSMMGFYPVTPGLPQYIWGSPVFTKVTISLQNGKTFVLSAPKATTDAKYIRSLVLDGRKVDVCRPLEHADILRGATVTLEMSER